jgi:hypothetical protein
MNDRHGARRWRPAVIVLGLGLLALATLAMIERPSSVLAKVFAMAATLAAFGLARSRAPHPSKPPREREPGGGAGGLPRLRRLRANRALWIASATLAVGTATSYWLMVQDQASGGHSVWPLYVFAGFALAGAVVWSILGTSLMQR